MTELNDLDLEALLHCNCASVRRAARVTTRFYDQCIAESGLGANQFTILVYLANRGPLRMLALAELLAMDRATIGHNLRPLERNGLLAIGVDETDARARLVHITQAGLTKLSDTQGQWLAAQAKFEQTFGSEESAHLRHILDNVTNQRLTAL